MEASGALALRPWIRDHGVAWEVVSACDWTRGAPAAAGREVTLYAPVPPGDPGPGCAACQAVYARLLEVAAAAANGLDWRVMPYRACWHVRRQPHGRPEVPLVVRFSGDGPARAFERVLERMGARGGGWPA
jgi:hypothetical protein